MTLNLFCGVQQPPATQELWQSSEDQPLASRRTSCRARGPAPPSRGARLHRRGDHHFFLDEALRPGLRGNPEAHQPRGDPEATLTRRRWSLSHRRPPERPVEKRRRPTASPMSPWPAAAAPLLGPTRPATALEDIAAHLIPSAPACSRFLHAASVPDSLRRSHVALRQTSPSTSTQSGGGLLYHRHSCSHRCWSLARTVAGASLARIRIIAGASQLARTVAGASLARTRTVAGASLVVSVLMPTRTSTHSAASRTSTRSAWWVSPCSDWRSAKSPRLTSSVAAQQFQAHAAPTIRNRRFHLQRDNHFFVDEELNTLVVDDETLTENHTSRHRR